MDNLETLKEVIRTYKKLAIAYSGGVDSTVLAAVAKDALGHDNVLLIHILSCFITHQEKEFAQRWATENDFNLVNVELNPLDVPEIKKNCEIRCYHCKKMIMNKIIQQAEVEGFYNIADGTNVDDCHKYRPGMKAAQELGILHPFIKAGFSKQLIRDTAKEYRIDNWNMSASACLATRVPVGTELTSDALSMVGTAEKLLAEIGFPGCRVRIFGETAKIEVEAEHFDRVLHHREDIIGKFKETGFKEVFLDLEGYRYGNCSDPDLEQTSQ